MKILFIYHTGDCTTSVIVNTVKLKKIIECPKLPVSPSEEAPCFHTQI